MTTWAPIAGWVGRYEVSDDGQVRSIDKLSKHGNVIKGRILKPGHNQKGYRIVTFSRPGGVRKSYPVHRLVAEAFIGPLPEGWHTMHIDGDNTNNVVSNLRYGTPSENELDKVRHGGNPNANKTHCPRGHEYTPENTSRDGRNGRRCKTCHRAKTAAWRAARSAA